MHRMSYLLIIAIFVGKADKRQPLNEARVIFQAIEEVFKSKRDHEIVTLKSKSSTLLHWLGVRSNQWAFTI